jgi:hypothetical protein
MSLNKQLVLSGLNLPEEIIYIIKNFAFITIVMFKSKQIKNVIIESIEKTGWSGKSRPNDIYRGVTLFWIDDICPQFQIHFCKKCGNYNKLKTINDKIMCNC